MTKLAKWMADAKETDASLAPKLGISRAHVSRLRRGKNAPSLTLAKDLEAITGIPWPDLMDAERSGCSASLEASP